MRRTLFPCYAVADREAAATMAAFLERGGGIYVFLEEGQLREGENLAHKGREARMADLILVLFSRASLPSRWPRSEWEDALVHEPAAENVQIAFARLDDCVAPRVLGPKFELARMATQALRDLKRWVRNGVFLHGAPRTTDVGVLGIALADRAGTQTIDRREIVEEFVLGFSEDFDAVLRLHCRGRSLAALAGDLGAQLGLRLEGELESNLERLREFCASRRFLIVMEDGASAPAELIPDGRTSTLICTEHADPVWEAGSLPAVQQAMAGECSWPEFCSLARQARRLGRDQGRLAECHDLMQQWHDRAEVEQDRGVLDESLREIIWILEGWGRTEEATRLDYRRAREFDEQIMLPFG